MLKLKDNRSILIIRFGLAAVFLANAYIAWFAPVEFQELLEQSFLADAFGGDFISMFVKLIGVSDSLVALLLLFGFKLKLVSLYASAWILGIIAVTRPVEPADVLEHLGFLSMAVYLWITS